MEGGTKRMYCRNVVVSAGPIPARVDSVKFITNRFKGGLALKTAHELARLGHNVTVVAWQYTDIPDDLMERPDRTGIRNVVRVMDVFEYYDWFVANAMNYDAFVMAAAVANLTPVKPCEGKFPSHLYKPGDEFDIRFMIAPRAIDAIKPINPRACLIGYKLFDAKTDQELVDIARHTLADAKANVIFANTPATAKSKKLAVMPDNSVIPCDFDQHVRLIEQAITANYYHTEIKPLDESQEKNPDIREALATVQMFEHTFNGFGTVAVPVRGEPDMFATTARGHSGRPVIVYRVDDGNQTVYASGKATLNAPALNAMLNRRKDRNGYVVVHRHDDDPNFDLGERYHQASGYQFPGTLTELMCVLGAPDPACPNEPDTIQVPHHGYLKSIPIGPVDWDKYHDVFPEKYFTTPEAMEEQIRQVESTMAVTLEIGCNKNTTATYAYDKYVRAEGVVNLTWEQIMAMRFDMVYIRNALNYLSMDEIAAIAGRCDKFIANTFVEAPEVKITDREVSVCAYGEDGSRRVRHTLRLPGDGIVRHEFNAPDASEYRKLGFDLIPYGRNSMLVTKGIEVPVRREGA